MLSLRPAGSGLVLGEGGVLLALESLESAGARGPRILAEIVGHAGTADIPHVRGWDSSGEGLARCMSAGAEDARSAPPSSI